MKKLQAIVADEFHRAVKSKAAEEGKTIKQVIVELLRAWLEEKGIEVD